MEIKRMAKTTPRCDRASPSAQALAGVVASARLSPHRRVYSRAKVAFEVVDAEYPAETKRRAKRMLHPKQTVVTFTVGCSLIDRFNLLRLDSDQTPGNRHIRGPSGDFRND
jgi:hypothetical protein